MVRAHISSLSLEGYITFTMIKFEWLASKSCSKHLITIDWSLPRTELPQYLITV